MPLKPNYQPTASHSRTWLKRVPNTVTRARLVQVASLIAADPALRRELKRTKRLPLQALCQATGLSRKVLKYGRRFIIALTILLAADEYVHLRDFFDLPSSGGEKG